jgi:hypothetical protein
MALKRLNKKVLSYSEIPKKLTEESWLNDYPNGCLVECHIDDDEPESLDLWIIDNYPELKDAESFLIDMDY